MAGKFDVYTVARGVYRWRIKAANGQTIATGGEGYTSKAGCMNGIESVRTNAPEAEVDDQTEA